VINRSLYGGLATLWLFLHRGCSEWHWYSGSAFIRRACGQQQQRAWLNLPRLGCPAWCILWESPGAQTSAQPPSQVLSLSLVPLWQSSEGYQLFLSSRTLAGLQKGVLQGSRVTKETCLHPVSFFCPFSSLVVPVLPLSPPPSTLPLSSLLFPLPYLPPCPLPLLFPSLWAPYLLISLPLDTKGVVKKGRGDTTHLTHQPFSTIPLLESPQRAQHATLPRHTEIVDDVYLQCPRWKPSLRWPKHSLTPRGEGPWSLSAAQGQWAQSHPLQNPLGGTEPSGFQLARVCGPGTGCGKASDNPTDSAQFLSPTGVNGTAKCPTSWDILIVVVITILIAQHPSLSWQKGGFQLTAMLPGIGVLVLPSGGKQTGCQLKALRGLALPWSPPLPLYDTLKQWISSYWVANPLGSHITWYG
jgi:hypothetical protein